MRGKGSIESIIERRIRITPAYAGKSKIMPRFKYSIEDHPRLCGEKFTARNRFQDTTGSPPPMRGKATCLSHQGRPAGITPAYAGKSFPLLFHPFKNRDHPRLCGEKFRIHLFITCQPGSPPPMRGKGLFLDKFRF